MRERPDRLSLHDVRCLCHIGVTEEERRDRQTLAVDLDLYADLERAARTGDLSATVDYRSVCEAIRERLQSGSFRLIEAAAKSVLDVVMERFPVSRAVVRVRKFVLPGVGDVEVRMERQRDE